MSAPPVTPERLMQLGTGHWAAATVSTAIQFSLFSHLEQGHRTAGAIAERAGISVRGAQALLDGLVGLGLVKLEAGAYGNAEDASLFLVEGKPTYLGTMVKAVTSELADWSRLPDVVKSGKSLDNLGAVPNNPFWEELVPGIAPLAIPTAQLAAARLRFPEAGAAEVLDIGGGSGVFAAILLTTNSQARATQLDWPNVNAIARKFVTRFGVADRFDTTDGDFHTSDLGQGRYSVIVYSNIAHQENPDSNLALFKRMRAALKPGGTLVISDFIQNDDRGGPPFALLFHMNMLLHTEGATYREADYRDWLGKAGFTEVSLERTPGPSALIFAR